MSCLCFIDQAFKKKTHLHERCAYASSYQNSNPLRDQRRQIATVTDPMGGARIRPQSRALGPGFQSPPWPARPRLQSPAVRTHTAGLLHRAKWPKPDVPVWAIRVIPLKKTGPKRPIFMPDSSTHRFSNHELHMTQLPQRPKAKPPEFTTP